MNNVTLEIEIENNQTSFLPGQTLTGCARWMCSETAKDASLYLIWYTEGRGDESTGLAEEVKFENPQLSDERSFEFQLPLGPYSFSGSLISLIWALELQVGKEVTRKQILLSPSGREILLHCESDL